MPDRADGQFLRLLSQTGIFQIPHQQKLKVSESLIPYDLNVAFWSDGAVKSRWVSVPGGLKIRFRPEGEWTFPPGTVFVKDFNLVTDETQPGVIRRLETRLLVCDSTGGVYGVTYKWRANNRDADLLATNLTETIFITTATGVRTQSWYYPIVGKRDMYHARAFMEDLAGRLSRRVQLSSDALAAYPEAVERGFGSEVDYGQLVKTYAVTNLNKDAASRYSPAEVVKAEKTVIKGMPDVNHITTSHIEKQNHTLRMHCRRLTRLTNAFSKKFENFEAAVAFNFAYYNFCKTHCTLRMTPAMAAGIESSHWTVADLVQRCGE